MDHLNRVIILIDMDCFYCQVEENLNSNIKGKPVAVVQSNDWKGGGIIAVNYAARDKGITRHMRGDEAKEKCPDIELVKIPQVRGKSDLTKYREAGKRVADVLLTFTHHLERASVDEAYLDITEIVNNRQLSYCDISIDKLKNTFVVGSALEDFIKNINCNKIMKENDLRLAIGGIIAEEIREKIFQVTEYRCSAGIAHNKILAKLVCGLHKPNQQTILPHEAVQFLFKDMSLKKIKGLGGKFGQTIIDKLHVTNMGDILQFSLKDLSRIFDDKAGTWLYNLARGIDMEPVNTRLLGKSINCCKQFQGKSMLTTRKEVEHWLHELADEMYERLEGDLEENKRIAKQMTVSFSQHTNQGHSQSTRSLPLSSYDLELIYNNALRIIEKNCQNESGSFSIKYLGVGVGNFEPIRKEMGIKQFFTNMKEKQSVSVQHKKDINVLSTSVPDNSSNTLVDANYLSTTQTEEKQDTSYTYFEEVYPESINDQSFINTFLNNDSVNTSSNSIDQEIFVCKPVNATEKTVSFFSKYYDMSDRECSSSKSSFIENTDQVRDNSLSKSIIQAKPIETQINSSETEMTVTCSEYLVKQERHLYKSENYPSKSSGSGLKNVKKKVITVKSKSILGYLKEEFDMHIDFHVAKKIRLEQNFSSPALSHKKIFILLAPKKSNYSTGLRFPIVV
ncbi:hypothetical protein GWI33_001960 [Rhynchophorus ferrugineus]|uniref:DNA polymerase eta n=1 Tax=Rhynchophorus ferrugineus TaxID=354439 RepID=A0A834IYW5_RHYFE|nr:hypothetical protein GWI33_001960 [Rhynchophorus ferrugineus]